MVEYLYPFMDMALLHSASNSKTLGQHLRTLSFCLVFISGLIYLIHRPEVNGMYSLVCLLFILRTALSLANYGLLLYAFNQTNSNGLNGFLNHFDDYVFDVKKLNQLVGYIQNMIVLYVWSYLILRTSFTFISFFCIAVNAYIFLAVPLYHGWLAFKEHKIDQIKIDSLKVFNRETFSANYRK